MGRYQVASSRHGKEHLVDHTLPYQAFIGCPADAVVALPPGSRPALLQTPEGFSWNGGVKYYKLREDSQKCICVKLKVVTHEQSV